MPLKEKSFARYARQEDGTYTVYNPAGRVQNYGLNLSEAAQLVKSLNKELAKFGSDAKDRSYAA